ncbi:unnamed protein product [Gongylonema pulchrum]|uniref:Cytoplasmic dynein 2 heavy chain 1 n=1 Tax=Gongylonema pulchrum TaxID=637853 RepID=A0A183DWD8_9BILA|nr:unnamed protein product [Gongylonema pulchrum]
MRTVLRRAGCRNEKICFIMDESNMLDTGFLERLNTLLANGEVPGLFEGDEYTTLMSQIKEGAHRQGLMLDSPDELYKWFTAQLNESEMKRGRRVMALTPRHFLDFIKHYINVFHEKRRDLEEEKLHLNIGLNKIKETEEQVLELQKSLTLKSSELEVKKAAANAKLKEMLSDQQRAEKEKLASEQLQKELAESLVEIEKKRTEVERDLAQVEPAVEEAKLAVKGIRKAQLVEVRSMASPPQPVRLALESICLLLGENVGTDWKAIRGVMVKDDFMPRILNFDTDSISPETLKLMEKYIRNPDWDFEKAQLLYSDMLRKVEPLRNELLRLEKDAKVGRSTQLLKSLGSERDRWHGSCDGFSQQMDSLIGDALLSAAFLAYSGYYDQQLRDLLFHHWTVFVEQAEIKHRSDLARVEYLSSVDERLEWSKNGLPVDELCTENAIMLHRFNRYPLIIDPSGQAINYLMRQFSGKNIVKTSFLDDSFRKNLESALRFGNSLLVQDVESYDPILNPVLNREVKRTGGRILITLGDQDIDLSPSFQIFLITRDASVEFAPDVCSRVTFVNFTVTRSSLEMQCLNQVLRSERPDVDEKRNDLLKLQGEFAVKLRQLEKVFFF